MTQNRKPKRRPATNRLPYDPPKRGQKVRYPIEERLLYRDLLTDRRDRTYDPDLLCNLGLIALAINLSHRPDSPFARYYLADVNDLLTRRLEDASDLEYLLGDAEQIRGVTHKYNRKCRDGR